MPPSSEYLAQTGVYIHPVEKVIYSKVNDVFGFTVVTKGMTYADVGKLFHDHWNSIEDPVAIDIDVEKMDRSVTSEILALSHKPILSHYPHDQEIKEWLSWQCVNQGRVKTAQGHLTYKVDGTLSSGQMNTSLAGITIVSGVVYTVMKALNIPYRFVDAGDDCTLIISRRHHDTALASMRTGFSSIGMTITTSPVRTRLEEIEFCQTHPIWFPSGWRMVRNPRSATRKDAMQLEPSPAEWKNCAWMKAVGLGGLSTHSGVPMLQEHYNRLYRSALRWEDKLAMSKRQRKRFDQCVDLEDGSLKWFKGDMNLRYTDIHWQTRVSFEAAFGIPPHEQEAVEEFYSRDLLEGRTGTHYLPSLYWSYQ